MKYSDFTNLCNDDAPFDLTFTRFLRIVANNPPPPLVEREYKLTEVVADATVDVEIQRQIDELSGELQRVQKLMPIALEMYHEEHVLRLKAENERDYKTLEAIQHLSEKLNRWAHQPAKSQQFVKLFALARNTLDRLHAECHNRIDDRCEVINARLESEEARRGFHVARLAQELSHAYGQLSAETGTVTRANEWVRDLVASLDQFARSERPEVQPAEATAPCPFAEQAEPCNSL